MYDRRSPSLVTNTPKGALLRSKEKEKRNEDRATDAVHFNTDDMSTGFLLSTGVMRELEDFGRVGAPTPRIHKKKSIENPFPSFRVLSSAFGVLKITRDVRWYVSARKEVSKVLFSSRFSSPPVESCQRSLRCQAFVAQQWFESPATFVVKAFRRHRHLDPPR